MPTSKYRYFLLSLALVNGNEQYSEVKITQDNLVTQDNLPEVKITQDNIITPDNLVEMFNTLATKVDGMEVEMEQLKKENMLLRTAGAHTCKDLKDKGFIDSGIYDIDPDSTGSTIQVHCDMLTGTTEVGHDIEDTVEIEYCSGDGCFNQEYSYSAPMNQVEALIAMSDTCEQEIKYDCNYAPLKANGLYGFYYGWWVDRHGQKKFYFDGSNEGLHVCGCYPNCQHAMFNNTCNCDASLVPFWNSDSGKITNKNSLPIKAFSYGGFISNQQKAKITVGKLRCTGLAPRASDLTSTCASLKKGGARVSGFYLTKPTIKSEDNLQVSYCRMSQPGYQEEILSLGEPQEINKKQIIIDIRVTTYERDGYDSNNRYNRHNQKYWLSSLKVNGNVTEEELNENGLDLKTGIFTIKESGIYMFYLETDFLYAWPSDSHIKANTMKRLKSGEKLRFKTKLQTYFDFAIFKLA